MDWTKTVDNPVDPRMHKKILDYLVEIRSFKRMSQKDWVISKVKGKRVLDIGMAEHDLLHMDRPNWKHSYIKENAKYCLGLDIIDALVVELNKRGYDVICMDATSDECIGELFDIVNIGDVIEHVNDPTKLMMFAKRHLAPGGEIIVSTPNPFFYKYIYRCITETTFIANFEHAFWITPSMALEIARRSSTKLSGSVVFSESKVKLWLKHRLPEILSSDFTYIFK